MKVVKLKNQGARRDRALRRVESLTPSTGFESKDQDEGLTTLGIDGSADKSVGGTSKYTV